MYLFCSVGENIPGVVKLKINVAVNYSGNNSVLPTARNILMRVVEDETCAFSCRSSKKSVVDRVGFEGWSFIEEQVYRSEFLHTWNQYDFHCDDQPF